MKRKSGSRRSSNVAFIYTDQYFNYDYGIQHPLKIERLKLVYQMLKAYDLLPDAELAKRRLRIETIPATEEQIAWFHAKDYIEAVKQAERPLREDKIDLLEGYRYGLGNSDNPIFRGMYHWSALSCGASIQAAEAVLSGQADIAFNIAGGLHHAHRDRASGFCMFNDPVLAIKRILMENLKVAYLDIDAHHADGVQYAFYDDDRVLTISIHQSGRFLFPGTGFPNELGTGKGRGYSVNLPLYPGTDDELYLFGFNKIVPPLVKKFAPDIIVCQLGADTHHYDPLAALDLTTKGFSEVVQQIFSLCPKIVALGGGGYNIGVVGRFWTIAYAIAKGVELDNEIPLEAIDPELKRHLKNGNLYDPEDLVQTSASDKKAAKAYLLEQIRYLEENVFPVCTNRHL